MTSVPARTVFNIVCFAICFSAIAGSSAPLKAQDWVRGMFTEFEHDFGTVARNEDAEHVFVIENKYEEDIHIVGISSSCRCTDLSIDKRVLKKNEKANLTAKFDTRNFTGAKQATVTIRFAPPFAAEVQLTVKGSIRGDVMFEPGTIDFGSVAQDSLSNKANGKQIKITKFNNLNWQIVDVKSKFKHIGVSISQPVRFGNQVQYDMNVRLKESAPPGFAQGELIVVANDMGRMVEVPLKFSAKIASALQISPDVITISTAKGKMFKTKVIVKANKAFRINDVTCSNTAFTVSADPKKSSKVHFVNVSYSADQPPGRYEYDLEFVTDLNSKTIGIVKAVVEVSADVQETTLDNSAAGN